MRSILTWAAVALSATALAQDPVPVAVGDWPAGTDRDWIGPTVWANRLQDWKLEEGRITCHRLDLPLRTLHSLTRRSADQAGSIAVRVVIEIESAEAPPPDALAGVWIGAGSAAIDPRGAALVQMAPGPDGGWIMGVDGAGRALVRQMDEAESVDVELGPEAPARRVVLEIAIEPDAPSMSRVTVVTRNPADGAELSRAIAHRVPDRRLAGNIALCCDRGTGKTVRAFRFDHWTIDGTRILVDDTNRFGPIAGTQYTLSRGTLKLTAQLLPLGDDELTEAVLEVDRGDGFERIATAHPIVPGYTATFRVDGWDGTRDVPYRVVFPLRGLDGSSRLHAWNGTFRAEPAPTDTVVVAGFTGNSMVRRGYGRPDFPWNRNGLWFPHDDLTAHVRAHDPDVLFFSGDQIYEGASPTHPEKAGGRLSELDYLYKWYLWMWSYRDLTKDRPTITIPDDHDVYQGNLWGAGGRATRQDSRGGYMMPPGWVRMVERTQTSHLPDPFDPTPIDQGIGVYYTSVKYGGVDFAVLEDRKFKSGCAGLVPPTTSGRPDHVVDPEFDPRTADVPGAQLLGARQERFLAAWAEDWSHGTRMKVALSQTVFAGLATHHGANRKYLVADYDSNGWPQSGRDRALAALRKGFAFMLGGDQHLATLCWHGIDDWRDAGWSMAVPSAANFYPRAWLPPVEGANRPENAPGWAGDHVDGFGNKVTLFAVTNPKETGLEPAALHDGMPGYGILRVDPAARTFVAECWPRASDPTDPEAVEYPGWPQTLTQRQMYGREPAAWLPPLRVEGVAEPVFRVYDADGELVYALRARESTFQPWTFTTGPHTVRVGDPDRSLEAMIAGDATTDRDRPAVEVELAR